MFYMLLLYPKTQSPHSPLSQKWAEQTQFQPLVSLGKSKKNIQFFYLGQMGIYNLAEIFFCGTGTSTIYVHTYTRWLLSRQADGGGVLLNINNTQTKNDDVHKPIACCCCRLAELGYHSHPSQTIFTSRFPSIVVSLSLIQLFHKHFDVLDQIHKFAFINFWATANRWKKRSRGRTTRNRRNRLQNLAENWPPH